MSTMFQHHPDNRILIVSGKQRYIDTVENFALDYNQPYPGLPQGVKAFRFVEGRAAYDITDDDRQVASHMNIAYVQAAIRHLPTILENQQQRRTTAEDVDESLYRDHLQANEQTLQQIAAGLGIDTASEIWRDDLMVRLAQEVFGA